MKISKALISAGGFGTRMKELTRYTPKPMLPVQGKPILEHSIDLCKRHGITDIAISVLYLSDVIKNYFRNGSEFGVSITYIDETEPLGTAGALNIAREWFDRPFVMCNADDLKDVDITEMASLHQKNRAIATIALTRVNDPSKYGVVEMESDRIVRFVEKPRPSETRSNLINAGLYILNPEIINYIPKGHAMIETDIFPRLAAQRMLYGYRSHGQWLDTGTRESYILASRMWKAAGSQAQDIGGLYSERSEATA